MAASVVPIEVEPFRLHGLSAVRMRSPLVDVVILPGKGADLHSMRCRATETEMLDQESRAAEIASEFLRSGALGYGDCYLGGWPSLLPSRARSSRVTLGPSDCGEAATVAWEARAMIVRGAIRLHCTAQLSRSGLHVSRTFGFDASGRAISVRMSVTNASDVPIEFHWTEHPTFGGDLLAGEFELILGPCSVHDLQTPGSRGASIDLGGVRLANDAHPMFRTLRSPTRHRVGIFNAARGVGCGLRWDGRQLPHAWYWQAHRDGRRMLAIEPSSSFGTELDDEFGAPPLRLEPGASITTRLTLAVINPAEAATLREMLAPRKAAEPDAEVRS